MAQENLRNMNEKTMDIWTSYKQLFISIESALICKKGPQIDSPMDFDEEREVPSNFEKLLRRHKQNFINILKNPPKSSRSRDDLRKGAISGITLPGVGHQILARDLVDEAIILSDMFDLDELLSLDLLCTAQAQMPHHPGLPRGLVAVLLYYDGRKSLVLALKALILARRGVSITAELPERFTTYITDYTAELQQAGLLQRLLDLIPQLDLSRELELLQQNRALGSAKHQKQVVELFESVRVSVASCVFWWSAQTGLPQEVALKLTQQLKRTALHQDSTGAIDDVTLALVMALLYAIDVSFIQRVDDGHPLIENLPALSVNGYLLPGGALGHEMTSSGTSWTTPGLDGLISLAQALSVATLQQSSNQHLQQLVGSTSDSATPTTDGSIALCEAAAFEFLHRTLLAGSTVHREEFYLRRLHQLLTDFVILMPRKVREMRTKGVEASRLTTMYMEQGLEPPSVPRDFEHFLLALARLYDPDPLKLELSLEWWCCQQQQLISSSPAPPRQAALLKFVKLAGDLLPNLHFTPYLKFLRSLSGTSRGAHCCFSMLKQDLSGGTVSWDHFFSALHRYHVNLRQDVVVHHHHYPIETVYGRGTSVVAGGGIGGGTAGATITGVAAGGRGITPGELQALHAVLQLIQTVAEHDPAARASLLEHPEWTPQGVLLGLVQCAVPIQLKAELVLTLAALSRSPHVAISTWHGLDTAQLLATCSTTSSYRPRGLRTELDEVESRNEEYPLTRAFLRLLNVLTEYSQINVAGSINIDPYVQYVVGAVLLRFRQRSYRHPEEKWQLAALCVMLLEKWLAQYDPHAYSADDSQKYQHPGYTIAQALHTKSELLRLILLIIEEGVQLLDTYTPFSGKDYLEEVTLASLKLLSTASELHQFQPGFPRLLLSLNPRTARPDHVVHIARYIRHWSALPEHAMHAAILLAAATRTPDAQPLLIGQFTSSASLAAELRHGFVECLEAELEIGEDEVTGVRAKTKHTILNIVEISLPLAAPNLGLWLVGFDTFKDVERTVLQQPGAGSQPRTVLHAILTLINQHGQTRSVSPTENEGAMLEAAWRVLYRLCSGPRTAPSVLRLLRTSAGPNAFLPRHLASAPQRHNRRRWLNVSSVSCYQLAWLLKTAAVEIRMCTASRLTTQLDAIVNALVAEVVDDMEETNLDATGGLDLDDARRAADQRLLRLLSHIPLAVAPDNVPKPQCELIDSQAVEGFFNRCLIKDLDRAGLVLIHVKKLHRLLMEEVGLVAGRGAAVAAAQRKQFIRDVEIVCECAEERNRLRRLAHAHEHLLRAWRRLAEALFALAPTTMLSNDFRQELLIDTLHTLIHKTINTHSVSTQVSQIASEAVVMFLGYLRHCQIVEATTEPPADNQEVSLISTTNTNVTSSHDAILLPTLQANIVALKHILCGLLQWLVNSSASWQKLRENLYAALLHFIYMTCLRDSHADQAKIGDEIKEVRRALSDYSIGLSNALCHDSTSGQYVTRMLALSLQTALLRVDGHTWLQSLSSRGHLRLIVDGLITADDVLVSLCASPRLGSASASLRPIYLHEAWLALLAQVAATHAGAMLLLELRVTAVLASMKVFDLPQNVVAVGSIAGMEERGDFLPTPGEKFQLVLFPVLDLLDALLTSLGEENRSCCEAILHFLLCHGDMVSGAVRGGGATLTAARLTRLIARSAASGAEPPVAAAATIAGSHKPYFLRQLMLGLVPVVQLSGSPTVEDFELAANLVAYIRAISCGRGAVGTGGGGLGMERDRFDWRGGAEPVLWPGLTEAQGGDRTASLPLLGSIVQLLSDAADLEKKAKSKNTQKEEEQLIAFVVENALYVTWTHLDVFMLRTASGKYDAKSIMATTGQDLLGLKAGLVTVFTDTFCKSVAEFGDKDFRGGLLRRIRRLLQFVFVK